MENNEIQQIKLRKYEHRLTISGVGVILFGAWNIIKAVIVFLVAPMERMSELITDDMRQLVNGIGISESVVTVLIVVFIFLGMLVTLAIRIYIGRAAIQDGRHIRRRRPFFIIWAFLVGIVLILNIAFGIANTAGPIMGEQMMPEQMTMSPEQMAMASSWMKASDVSVFVDATSLFCVVELIIAAITVRRLRRGAE